MNKTFYPSINDIYFKNFEIVEDKNGIKHIRGDLYIKSPAKNDTCIGYYNPVYQTSEDAPTQYFLRLEEDYQFLYEVEGKYESIFNKKMIPLTEYDCPVGLQELIYDLELITYLYTFMNSIRPNNDFERLGLVGVINETIDHTTMKVIQIKDKQICTNQQIIEFIDKKIDSINFDHNYPVHVFKNIQDFSLRQRNGKFINWFDEVEDVDVANNI